MPQFNKRGNRIRASDKSLVFRFSSGSLLLLFLAVVMLLNLKTIITTDWKVISLFQDGSVHLTVTPYRIMTIVLAALVCVLATLFYRRFQYDRVKQLFHRQKLARMLLENEPHYRSARLSVCAMCLISRWALRFWVLPDIIRICSRVLWKISVKKKTGVPIGR